MKKQNLNPRLSHSSKAYLGVNFARKSEIIIENGSGRMDISPYRPLFTVRWGTSGFATRHIDPLTGELIHAASSGESDNIRSLIFEVGHLRLFSQVGLFPRNDTIRIAEELKIKHPRYPDRRTPVIMSTDLVHVKNVNGVRTLFAYSIKSSRRLTKRAVELGLIEACYWAQRGVIFERRYRTDACRNRIQNVRWIENFTWRSSMVPSRDRWPEIEEWLYRRITAGEPVTAATRCVDHALKLLPGVSMTQIRFYIASGIWSVDLDKAINVFGPLEILGRTIRT